MKVVELLDQASKDGPRGSLREQVGEHHDAGEVFDRDNATVDEIAKELGGAQDVLGLVGFFSALVVIPIILAYFHAHSRPC